MEDGDDAAVANFLAHFAGRIFTPSYAVGDAMMLCNWTLHFTYAHECMTRRRENVELRVSSDDRASLATLLARRTGIAAASIVGGSVTFRETA